MQNQNYQHLLQDESFLSYCLGTNPVDVAHWEAWLKEKPDAFAEIKELKHIVISLAVHTQDVELRTAIDEMRKKMQLRPPVSVKLVKRFNFPKLAVAAIFLCVVGIGIVYFTNQPSKHKYKTTTASSKVLKQKDDGSKAVLTLANGKSIVLEDNGKGEVISTPGLLVYKTASGELVYKVSSGHSLPEQSYNTIKTPIGGQYQIVLPDGSKAFLNAASSLKYGLSTNDKVRQVELVGEAYFEIKKSKEKPFIVKANGVDVRVLGTHFNVTAYSNDKAVVTTLLEGAVDVTKGNAHALLKPGQQASTMQTNASINVQEVDVDETVAWRKGQIIFHDESIMEVMKKAARWYDIEVEYEGDFSNKNLGGRINKYDTIEELLDNMSITGGINYKINGKKITIMN